MFPSPQQNHRFTWSMIQPLRQNKLSNQCMSLAGPLERTKASISAHAGSVYKLPLDHYRIQQAFIHTHGFPNCAEFEGMSVASLLSRSFQTTPKRTNVVVLLPFHRKICNMKLSCGFSSFRTCTHFHTWTTSKSKKPGLMEHVSRSSLKSRRPYRNSPWNKCI